MDEGKLLLRESELKLASKKKQKQVSECNQNMITLRVIKVEESSERRGRSENDVDLFGLFKWREPIKTHKCKTRQP